MKTKITLYALFLLGFYSVLLSQINPQRVFPDNQRLIDGEIIIYPTDFDDLLLMNNQIIKNKKTKDISQNNDNYVTRAIIDSKTLGYQMRYSYGYDDNGNFISYIIESWVDSKQDWEYLVKGNYIYDNEGKITSRFDQSWQNGEWINGSKDSYGYDENGNWIDWLWENWDGTKWEKYIKVEFTYDSDGNRISSVFQIWNGDDWENYQNYIYEYDQNGNNIFVLYQTWGNKEWVSNWSETYIYEDNDLINKIRKKSNNGTDWVMDWKEFYENEEGKQILITRQIWNGSIWVNLWKETYEYYDIFVSSLLREVWDNNNWINATKATYSFNEKGDLIKGIFEKWGNGAWNESDGTLKFRDYTNRNFSYNGFQIDVDWSNTSNVEQITEKNLVVFPNPFSNYSNLSYQLNTANFVKIDIFNSIGEYVTTLEEGFKNAEFYQINFNAKYLPQGIYYYKLQIGDKIESGQLMLVR